MKTIRDLILDIYESHRNGVIDTETRDLLLEACDDSECDEENTETKDEDNNDEDEIIEYKKTIKKLKEKLKKANSEKSIENIKDKAKESLEDLIDVADDEDIEKKLEELYDEFIDDIEDDDDDESDDDKSDDNDNEETVEERVNQVLLSIHEYHNAGYITESERDELLEIVNESLREKIVTAAKNGKKLLDSESMKGLSPDYRIDGLSTGLQMMKKGKLEQDEKARKQAELRQRLNFATANAGVGK